MKKIMSLFLILVLALNLNPVRTFAYYEYSDLVAEITWSKYRGGWVTDYYLQKCYWGADRSRHTATLGYLCNPTRWYGTGSGVQLSAQVGITIAKTDGWSFASKLGFQVPGKGVGATSEITYGISESLTITKSNVANYTYIVDETDPYGYYTIEARNSYYIFDTFVYTRTNKYMAWQSVGNGKTLGFTSYRPYVDLVYSYDQPF